ncbi:MAG: translation initiation factor IF-3 [Candidatus Komeilibacteria bacterium RIFCSPLOWO2_01_FULL_52_15]|uniref:Translation initiation factor IF-3 n=2 Tax=Candidatus Komeiliibacteriota TaxID=1817908 RepID=A0A1G2BQD0_9BACT|nr:MAG: translation initiation factor IF-3 [Candidatus Komeilibacteria bacterium RIFCSPHIGHO2_01_FULL_52_14]OGY91334.1 MAG: translation initiation factor IF-3 [Candidatus Komeilibacteria bacterium RIFCSPLOWO2_01_FULL_52_15]
MNTLICMRVRELLLNHKTIHRRFHATQQTAQKRYRVNQWINSPEIMVIDEDGSNLGRMRTAQALSLAHERELDLIEVSPLAQPPVCRIMNLGKWQYLQSQKIKRQKTLETKIIRLSFKIAEHDRQVRIAQALKFLTKGHKVKIEMRLRGREQAFVQQAKENIHRFITDIAVPTVTEQDVNRMGNTLSAQIVKK